MQIRFDLPTITLRCGRCTETAPEVALRRDGMFADIACTCAVPAFELVFTTPKHRDPLVILPLELAAPKVAAR